MQMDGKSEGLLPPEMAPSNTLLTHLIDLLKAFHLPQQVAVVHYKAHQKGDAEIAKEKFGLQILPSQVALQEHPIQGALLLTSNSLPS